MNFPMLQNGAFDNVHHAWMISTAIKGQGWSGLITIHFLPWVEHAYVGVYL